MNQLFLASLLLLPAALSPEADSAIARLNSRYSDGVSHTAAFTHLYTAAGFTTPRRESGTIWIQRPQLLRFDYLAPEKKVFTYESGEGRLYAPEDKQLTIQKVSREDQARLPILLLTDPAALARDYDLSVEPAASGETGLLLKPRVTRPELSWLRVTVLPDGAVARLSYEDSAGNRTEFQFEGWRREKARPKADFRVTGPRGTRVLEN